MHGVIMPIDESCFPVVSLQTYFMRLLTTGDLIPPLALQSQHKNFLMNFHRSFAINKFDFDGHAFRSITQQIPQIVVRETADCTDCR